MELYGLFLGPFVTCEENVGCEYDTCLSILASVINFDVNVGVGIEVGIGIDIGIGINVGVGIDVGVRIEVAVGIGIGVSIDVGIAIDVGIGVSVSINVGIGVSVGIDVGVGVGFDKHKVLNKSLFLYILGGSDGGGEVDNDEDARIKKEVSKQVDILSYLPWNAKGGSIIVPLTSC
jgi:hypothetical protein